MRRVIVVTGGFGALGKAVIAAAAEQGAIVVAIDLASDQGGSGATHSFGEVDLSNLEQTRLIFDRIVQRTSGIDVLVNAAGGFRWQGFAEADDTCMWDLLQALNLKTALNASKAALPFLLKSTSGRIINVGARAALQSAAGMGAYAASKAGVHRFTESLAEELKGTGVTVNAVLPSVIDTPANRSEMPGADVAKWVKPGDLAHVILFLASENARAITGALIPVAGLM